jgi:hypothetical protein
MEIILKNRLLMAWHLFRLSLVILGSLIIMTGCEQEDDLVAITSFVTIEPSITITGFETGGRLAANRKIEFLEYGVVYSTSVNPTTENDIISPGTDLIVSDNRNRFSAEFTYYIKAFASTRSGTAYGNQISFTVN